MSDQSFLPELLHTNVTPAQARRRIIKVSLLLALLGAAVAATGLLQRRAHAGDLQQQASQAAVPTVSVVTPTPSAQSATLQLPGTLEPLQSADIYAQSNGYVRQWLADLGDAVSAGQLLAVLDTPELAHQLAQAKADYSTAEAEYNNARSMASRAERLQQQRSGAISAETAEQRLREAEAKAAIRDAAQANVQRLQALQDFSQLKAPFAGVITSRQVQLGQLVVAGVAGSKPLFSIADTSSLRIFVRVPQQYAPQIKAGLKATLQLPEYPGRAFHASVSRSSGAVDKNSGTMLVELQTANADGQLLPGAYTQVSFELAATEPRLKIPGSAVLFRDQQPQVAVLDAQDIVSLRTIQISRDLGAEVELSSGLSAGERVVSTPPDAISDGDHVRPLSAPH